MEVVNGIPSNIKKNEAQQPLKFKVNSETGNVEDAEGSHLIQEYCSAVRNLHAGYESLRGETQEELKELEVALSKMFKDSDEYFAIEIYRNKLVSKISRSQKKASDISNQETFFRKVLAEIYKSAPCMYSNSCFNVPVPHYELLSKTRFNKMDKLDFFCIHTPNQFQVGKHSFALQLNHQFSTHGLMEEFQMLRDDKNIWKLTKAQKEIFKKSKLIYHLSTKTEHKLVPKEQLSIKAAQNIAQENQKTVIQLLKEEIDALIFKVEGNYIPKMAPKYFFAKAVMAFCEEVVRHRPTK